MAQMTLSATYKKVHVSERHQVCEKSGQCSASPLPPPPSSQITLPTTLPPFPKQNPCVTIPTPLHRTTPTAGFPAWPTNPHFAGCTDARLANSYTICSETGVQQTREPWHAALDRRQVTIYKSLLCGYVFFYSEPVWQYPDGVAKTHIAQKIQIPSCGHNACKLHAIYLFIWFDLVTTVRSRRILKHFRCKLCSPNLLFLWWTVSLACHKIQLKSNLSFHLRCTLFFF